MCSRRNCPCCSFHHYARAGSWAAVFQYGLVSCKISCFAWRCITAFSTQHISIGELISRLQFPLQTEWTWVHYQTVSQAILQGIWVLEPYILQQGFFGSRIMDRLGSATAFYSDQAVDSDHDQSETTQWRCKKSARDDPRSKNWTLRSSYETLSRTPRRACLRDDPVTKTWHNTAPRIHSSINVGGPGQTQKLGFLRATLHP